MVPDLRSHLFIGCIAALALGCAGARSAPLLFVPGPTGVIEEHTIPNLPVVDGRLIGYPLISHAVDWTGTGRADLFVGMGVSPSQPLHLAFPLRVLRPDAGGTSLIDVTRLLLGSGALPATEHAREIVAGDFNRDGKLDIFVAAHGYDAPPYSGERNVLVYSNADGTLADRSGMLPPAPDFSHCAAIGDVNGDGRLDVYVGNVTGNPPPYFLMGRADGGFDPVVSTLPADIRTPGSENRFHACLLLDVDDDGAPDLIVGSGYNGDRLSLQTLAFLNDGTGDFGKRAAIKLPHGPFGGLGTIDDIVAIDVNDDRRPDLLVLSTQSGSKQDVGMAIQVLVNHGGGVFVDESAARLGASASRFDGRWWVFLRVADIDGDGRLDFYASGGPQPALPVPIIWLNNGNGTFSPVTNDIFPNELSPIEALDVDGDGQLDFVSVFANAQGKLQYRTWLNRTPRTAPLSKPVVEFYNPSLDHYFMTWMPEEIAKLDTGVTRGWSRTGQVFRTLAGVPAELTQICRIYIVPGKGDSHFFGRGVTECADTMSAHPDFVLETETFMAMRLPVVGTCPFGSVPVYRVFSNRADANHRYLTDRLIRVDMVAKGWLAEGDGPDLVVMCAGP